MKYILTIILTLFVLTSFGQESTGYTIIDSEHKWLPRRDTIKLDTTISFVFIVDSSGFVKRKKAWKVDAPRWVYGFPSFTSDSSLPIYLDFDTKKEIKEEDIVRFLILDNSRTSAFGSLLPVQFN